MENESKDVVLPGEQIGVLEEFIPGIHTYERDGKIYASTVGTVVKDLEKKEISLKNFTKKPCFIEKGDIVIGRVDSLKKQMAMVSIVKIEGEKGVLSSPIIATLHISQIKQSYVADFNGVISDGDVIRATVLNASVSQYQLGIMDNSLGVIKSFCRKCRKSLVLKANKLECPICGYYQFRKIAPDYGKGVI